MTNTLEQIDNGSEIAKALRKYGLPLTIRYQTTLKTMPNCPNYQEEIQEISLNYDPSKGNLCGEVVTICKKGNGGVIFPPKSCGTHKIDCSLSKINNLKDITSLFNLKSAIVYGLNNPEFFKYKTYLDGIIEAGLRLKNVESKINGGKSK